jgi:predicted HicB family RNase H-like nuclease
VYAAVADDMTLTGEMYATIFDLHAEMFEEDYDGLKSYNAFHNKLVDEIYEEIA